MSKIIIDIEDDTVFAYPSGFMGDSFWTFRDACINAGARWNRVRGDGSRHLIAAADAPRLLEWLSGLSLDTQVTPTAAEGIKRACAAADRAMGVRLGRIDEHIESLTLPFFDYQRDGVAFLRSRKAALLADDMGLGKTLQALAGIPRDGCAVVVCPAGVKSVWESECRKWRPDLTPVILKGRKSFRWPEKGELIITNPDILPDDAGIAVQGCVVVADEAHMFKGAAKKTARVRRFRTLARSATDCGGRVWLLTGTPMKNRPNELWNLLTCAGLQKEAYGNWNNFMRAFGGYRGRFGVEWGDPTTAAAEGLSKVSLRRSKTDVLKDLPAKRIEDVPVAVGSMRLATEVMAEIPEGFDMTGADFSALKSVIAFDKISAARAALAKAKIPALIEHVLSYEEAETPLVVFSAHRAPIDALAERDGWAVITGDTPSDERGRIQERFQAGQLKGIAGTYGAMGTGVTLTHASDMILCDLPWTPADLSQAMDRIHRIGQKSSCLYKILSASHDLDALVNRLIVAKVGLIKDVVEATNDADGKGNPLLADALTRAEKALSRVTVAVAPVAEEKYSGGDVRVRGKTELTAEQIDWVFEGLQALAASCDGANDQDGMGFNRLDTVFGRDLARQATAGILSPAQLEHAATMLKKYRGQIGAFPSKKGE